MALVRPPDGRVTVAEGNPLLPTRPPGSRECPRCKGTGYIHRDVTGQGVVCPECSGLGWKPL